MFRKRRRERILREQEALQTQERFERNERAGKEICARDCDGLTDGDLATFLAEDAGYALRDHATNPQTFFEVMSEQLPDVHFTIQQQDAVSMMAAMIREQRLEGILEGLRLAGLLNEAPKRGRTSPQTEGLG